MDAATTHWVCPTCGTENGAAEPAVAPTATAPARATPAAEPSRGRSVFAGSERIPLIAVVVGAVIVVLAFAWWPRHSSTPLPTPSGSSPAAVTAAQALDTLCHDIPIDQNIRVDALQRTADQVRTDAKALRKAGDPATAQQAMAVAEAMEALRTKLETHGDTTAETAQLEAATSAMATTCQGG